LLKKRKEWYCPNCRMRLDGRMPSEKMETMFNCIDCDAELKITKQGLVMLND